MIQKKKASDQSGKKHKGKRAADIKVLPLVPMKHKTTEEELIAEFGEDIQLEDEISHRYRFCTNEG